MAEKKPSEEKDEMMARLSAKRERTDAAKLARMGAHGAPTAPAGPAPQTTPPPLVALPSLPPPDPASDGPPAAAEEAPAASGEAPAASGERATPRATRAAPKASVGGTNRVQTLGLVVPEDIGRRLGLWHFEEVAAGRRGEVAEIIEHAISTLRKGDQAAIVRYIERRYQPQGRIIPESSERVNTRVTKEAHQKLRLYVAQLRVDGVRTTMQAVATFLLDRVLPPLPEA